MITKIQKRDGRIVDFDKAKIADAIFNAAKAVGGSDRSKAERLAEQVVVLLHNKGFGFEKIPDVETLQDSVEKVLIENGHARTAKAYILYREERSRARFERQKIRKESKVIEEIKERIEGPADDPLEMMFRHKSKMAKLISQKTLNTYKELLFMLRKMQKNREIPTHPENSYLGDNVLAKDIYLRKYYVKDLDGKPIETRPEEVFARLAAFMAAVEDAEEKRVAYAVKFYRHLYEGHFLPGGRVIAGAGDLYRLKTLANCFVSMIESDNMESIYKTAYECARTYSYGGGIGVDMSTLRPRNSVVHNASDFSTGSVSFMELYSLTTGLIGQSGRRGALMLTLDVKHPDVFNFIKIKQDSNWVTRQIVDQCSWSGMFDKVQLSEVERQVRENTQVRFANISLKVCDEFMNAVEEQAKYSQNTILVYRRLKDDTPEKTKQGEIRYSIGIPSKDLNNYQIAYKAENIGDLNLFLKEYGKTVAEEELKDLKNRTIFGDYIVKAADGKDLAIHYAGDFILYFNSDQTGEVKKLVKAREIWNQFVASNYKTAEPGLIFWSRMTKYSPTNYIGRPIISTNPCGEIPLQDGGACNLGSVNLSRFVNNGYTKGAEVDWERLRTAVHEFTRFLDNTITWNEQLNPLEKQRIATGETRRLGLGVMGIADMMNQLGIGYDSEEALELLEKVMKFIANESYRSSAALAKEKAPAPLWDYQAYSMGPFFRESLTEDVKDLIKDNGLRNLAILTIAPTGTLSNIVLGFVNGVRHYAGVSSGVEPVFALYYRRRSETLNKEESSKFYTVFHPIVEAYVEMAGLKDSLADIEDLEEMRKVLPEHFFRTAHFIDPMKRVQIQGICQKYIDHSISSTVNLPESIKPDIVSQIYFEAWKKGLKGITIYRDGSRYPILSVATQQSEFQKMKSKPFKVVTASGELFVKGDEVFAMDDGSLSTVFHSLEMNHPVEIIHLDPITLEPIGSNLDKFFTQQKQGTSSDPAICKIELKDGKVVKTCEE